MLIKRIVYNLAKFDIMHFQPIKDTFCFRMVLRFFLLESIVLPVLITSQTLSGLEKSGRCASVTGKCTGASPSSRCFFHFDCPGNQLCCSIDGCINACMDPIQNSSSLSITDLLSQSDKLLSSADNGYYFSTAQKGPYFKCKDGLLIKSSYRCNGNNDCPDGDNADEMDCPCARDEVPCTNGLCVKLSAMCSPTGAARNINAACTVQNLNCSSVNCPGTGDFRCSNGQCIPLSSRCDGTFSCLDGSDEQDCVCSSGNFRCDDGLCKSFLNVWCNGEADCSDHTDEPLNCSCVPGQFKCKNGRCIPEYGKCDFVDDCLDGSDEADCTMNCATDVKLLQCANGQCISRYSQCDGFADCQDGSDERNCTKSISEICNRPGYFLCSNVPANSSRCVPMAAWCDGIMDCPDHSDEPQFCSTICPTNSFSCDGGRCMPVSSKCDGKMDCVDKTDETGCQCQENELPLPNSACLAKEKFCNGVKDAANGLDEEQCTTCKDSLRRDFPNKLCDGAIDCPDSSDELFCGSCTTAQFYCIKSRQCIFRNQTCDGYPDCSPFGEDEETCLGVTPLPCHIDSEMSSIQPERAGCLTVRNRGDWMPVCAERWLSSLSDAICEIMGYDKSITTNLIPMDPSEITDRPVKIPRQIEGPQLVISAAMNCPSRKKVYLECGSLLCGQSLPDNGLPRFLPGYNRVSDGKHPWSVMLYRDGKYFCSAVVIDAEWVLTSAKCVISIDIGSSYIVARLGMTRRFSHNGNEQFIPVDYIAVHPNYSVSINPGVSSADADLALLHLDIPVHWNSFVKPVCLPRSTDPPTNVALIGWSVVRGQRVYPTEDSLQEVTVNTLNTTFCLQNPLVEKSIGANVFCANFSGISPGNCTTDLGGPALNKDNFGRWSVVGIVSFTLGCNMTGAVAGFVNVAKHRTWINDILTKSKKPDLPQDRLCVGGYRCEVGTCINPSQRCDGTLDCPLGSDEYGCISPSLQNQTGSCNFSDATLCGYRQDLGDSLNFYRGNVGDASFLTDREKWLSIFSGSFLYVSSLMSNPGKGVARLISPRMNGLPFTKCLKVKLVSNNGNLTIYDFVDPSRVYLAQRKGDTIATLVWTIPQNTSAFVLEAKLSGDKESFLAISDFVLDSQSCVL